MSFHQPYLWEYERHVFDSSSATSNQIIMQIFLCSAKYTNCVQKNENSAD